MSASDLYLRNRRRGLSKGDAALEAVIEDLFRKLEGEREARHKCEVALTAKDKAMGVLFERLNAAGVDCSDLIS